VHAQAGGAVSSTRELQVTSSSSSRSLRVADGHGDSCDCRHSGCGVACGEEGPYVDGIAAGSVVGVGLEGRGGCGCACGSVWVWCGGVWV